ncbi:MAG: UvrD-helicase domain-containing protein [Bacteroidota bacterium]
MSFLVVKPHKAPYLYPMQLSHLKIISAGAGSGKTYRLTQEMVTLLRSGAVRPSGIIATTFTRKAAGELQERVRVKLLQDGMSQQADELTNALIGTVHGLGVKLLRRFAFEAGVSPQVDILPDGEEQRMFNQALAATLSLERIEAIETLAASLGLTKRSGTYDWRSEVRKIVDVARSNAFTTADLERSQQRSWESFAEFLPAADTTTKAEAHAQLDQVIAVTMDVLTNGPDQTKTTQTAIDNLHKIRREYQLRGHLPWHQWAKLGKLKVGAKSREAVEPLEAQAAQHMRLAAFQDEIRGFVNHLFEVAAAAIEEFDQYKKRRGLIDYTDMEVLVNQLLDQPPVRAVLADELDLLMVDEFQDTNPIQLAIFMKLVQLAQHAVWVGDPKQSIYGFRGAEPRLMQAIIDATGGIQADNVQKHSWRSREDLVYAANAIFTKAFPGLPPEQVALEPQRMAVGNAHFPAESPDMENGLQHWHLLSDNGRRTPPAAPWMEEALARQLKEWLDSKVTIQPKGTSTFRTALPGDVAILCRSNRMCQLVAAALHGAGLKAAISRAGLLDTAEIRLVLACLKYILSPEDSLSVAEIQVLGARKPLEEVVADRLSYLKEHAATPYYQRPVWAAAEQWIATLDGLRAELTESSSAEVLHLVLEELDLRRFIVRWGSSEQRLANIDQLRHFALEYEANCNNTQTAASLGGFLLWLNRLNAEDKDLQGAGEDEEAVNVLTYHRSKGLEWPVVICHNLENPLRADLWGLDLIPETDTVDLNDLLGGRYLRYWVNPYADQVRNTPLATALAESTAQTNKQAQAMAEEARLLYVGITRARDYLILPTRQNKKPTWLNRVYWHNPDTPALDENTSDTPWEWNGRWLDKETVVRTFPTDFTVAERRYAGVPFLAPVAGQAAHAAYSLAAAELFPRNHQLVIQTTLPYWVNPSTEDWPEAWSRVQLYFFRAAAHLQVDEAKARLAQALCDRFEIEVADASQNLIRQEASWQSFLQQQGVTDFQQHSVPFHSYHDGRQFKTVVDQIFRLQDGRLVFCQRSDYGGETRQKITDKIGEQLVAAAQLWEAEQGVPVEVFWIHFTGPAKVVSVVLEQQ